MKGNEKVVARLNALLADELAATNQTWCARKGAPTGGTSGSTPQSACPWHWATTAPGRCARGSSRKRSTNLDWLEAQNDQMGLQTYRVEQAG